MRALCVIVQGTPADAAASNGLSPYFSRLLEVIPSCSLAFAALVERAAKDVLGLVVLSLERFLARFNRLLPADDRRALVRAMNCHVLRLTQHDCVDAMVARIVQRALCCTQQCAQLRDDKRQKLDDYVDRGASSVGSESPAKRIRSASLLQC